MSRSTKKKPTEGRPNGPNSGPSDWVKNGLCYGKP